MEKYKDAIIKVTTDDGKVLTIVSKRGEKGETGENGKDGKDGKDGTNGLDGKDGKDGLPGVSGKDGTNGIDGVNGKDGKDGKNGKDGKDGSSDTPEQVKEKLLKVGIKYDEIQNTPDINKIVTIVSAGIKQASKTVSLTELDDVNLSGLTQTDGKYNLGSGGGGGTPAGSNGEWQYNDNGVFGAMAGITYETSNGALILDNALNANALIQTSAGTGVRKGIAFQVGESSNTNGADFLVSAGDGATKGGDVLISGGDTTNNTGGEVIISGGSSTNNDDGAVRIRSDKEIYLSDIAQTKGLVVPTESMTSLFIMPLADGSAGEFVKTDGAGNLSFGAPTPSIASAEIDFGTVPVRSKRITVTDAAITTSSKIMVSPDGAPATGRVGNDWEWDTIAFSAVPGTGNFLLTGTASGRIVGKRRIYYTYS